MPRSRFLPLLFVVIGTGLARAQAPAITGGDRGSAPARKQALAVRVDADRVHVDGRLDEEAWLAAAPIDDFTQKEPTEGAPPTDAMEVRFLYDESALYVGARMYTTNAADVQAPLGRRDNADQAEHILVSLDTFLDHRTAVVLGVTAAGVRIDRYHATDNENSFDAGFDLVWEAQTARDDRSWTAELWIPFAQLRFNPQDEQVWGLNVQRFRPTLDEEDFWIVVPRTERAWASRFGELRGIAAVRPTRRLELLPYVAGSSTLTGNGGTGHPFDDGRNLSGRTGGDLKMGLGPNLTLEATFNPDFGQVEADAAEVNLSAFETRFPEKRPFFLEGAPLFNIGHPNFYYSRRIGARPIGPAADDYVDYPSASTILGAAKLTGRLPSKTSVAFLSAITEEESARLACDGEDCVDPTAIRRVRVAPRAYHAVGRVLQEFGPLASTAGAFINVVHRDLAAGDPLADLLTRNALGIAGNTTLRFKGGEYELRASGGTSFIDGEPKAIERVQRTSAHYAQRPDRTYSPLDPTLTSLTGWTLQANFDRTSGRHWLWGTSTKIDSENFDPQDYAQLNGADGVLVNGNLRYRETQPGRVFRAYSIDLNMSNDSTLRWLRQGGSIRPNVSVTWANFWTSSVSVTRNLPQQSVSLTRGGPLMARAGGWSSTVNVGNRSTSETRLFGNATIARTDDGGSTRRASVTASFRPGPRWQLSVNPYYERLTETQQYVTTLAGGRPETYGSRYVFAYIDRSTVSMEYRLGLTIRPDVNLDVYAEPFAASGRYYDYGELAAPRSADRITYGQSGTGLIVNADGSRVVDIAGSRFTLRNRDFNTLSFRSNVVLRWEWRPGSTLYLVWQQDRSGTEAIGEHVGLTDAFRSLRATGSNVLVVKTSFWLPIY
jgi:hypothetical protein